MKTFKGTKGNWAIIPKEIWDHDYSEKAYICTQHNDGSIKNVIGTTTIYHREQGKANAQLIAAAPELLEALQAVMSYEETPPEPSVRAMAKKAINKALGQ